MRNRGGSCERDSRDELICASRMGYHSWVRSINEYENYLESVNAVLRERIEAVSREAGTGSGQLEKLQKSIENDIRDRLRSYGKDVLFVALLSIKEGIQRILLKSREPDWLVNSDMATINLLLKYAAEGSRHEEDPKENAENGWSDLTEAIVYARKYILIKENISLTYGKDVDLDTLCFSAICTEETERFFDLYFLNGQYEKPEDYRIKTEALRKKLEAENRTPEKILENLEAFLSEVFGFRTEDLRGLSRAFFSLEFPGRAAYDSYLADEKQVVCGEPVFILQKRELKKALGAEAFEKIMDTFSLNRRMGAQKDEAALELYCFYETKRFVLFGNFDLAQTISVFEKLILSGHYLHFYRQDLSADQRIVRAQKSLSKYFAYCVADCLFANAYCLPTERYQGEEVPRVEINKIKSGGKNILMNQENKSLGDIDVLALDKRKKQILLLELKYYKPPISTKDMLLRDKSLVIDNEVFKHIRERERAVYDHREEVVKFITGEEESGYTVRSVLLTSRTNFYGVSEREVEYLTWAQFCEKVKKCEL